ncbi:MAG: hypothetical protein WCJ29_01490 [bacterium]
MIRGKKLLKKRKLSLIEKLYVQHAHPINLIMTLVGIMWGVYFLWLQNILLAAIFAFGFMIIGHASVWGENEDGLAETWLGKIMILHSHPINTLFHLVGTFIVAVGLYSNVIEMIMWGVTILLFGHLWGWSRVHLLGEE